MKKELKNSFGKVYLTITWDEKNGWIINNWEGMLSVENVMQGASEVLKVMRQTGCHYLLNDNRQVTGSWNQANDWIEQTWMPQALALGLRRFAHIVPSAMFGVTSAEEMLKRMGQRFEMRLFKSRQEAKQWLTDAQKMQAVE